MLQRCHVCGKTGGDCKPCEHCGWWFCGKHIDPEQHECTGLKILRQAAVKPERQETPEQTVMPIPLTREAQQLEKPVAVPVPEAAGSLLDENLSKGLEKRGRMILLYIVGSPIIGILIYMGVIMSTVGSVALMGLGISTELLGMALSLWVIVYSLGGFGVMMLFMAAIFMLVLLAVGGGLMVLAIEYGHLLPAFKSLKRYDESFGKPLLLVKIGCIGPVMLLIGLVAMVLEASTGRPVSTTPLLFWIGIVMLLLGQIGLALGLFKLRKKLGDSRFSTAATMFIINLVLSLALSPLAVVAGLAGWVLTSLATRAALKRKVSQTVYT